MRRVFWKISKPILLLFLLPFLLLMVNCAVKGKVFEGRPDEIIVNPEGIKGEALLEHDSITVIATDVYDAGWFKRAWQGSGYRDAWSTPIRAKVARLDTLMGGLEPDDRGGGNQTLSFDLEDEDEVTYTLRSINKDPSVLITKFMRRTGTKNLVLDAISQGHPYGALVIPALSDAAGILHTNQQLVYLPNQPELGKKDEEFGGRLYLLEFEPEGNPAWVPLPNVTEILDTEDLVEYMEEHPEARIAKDEYIRARLFDVLVGDWDRHAGQWGWAKQENGEEVVFHPLPTDRDMVFYGISGFMPWLVSRPFFVGRLRPFKKKVDYFPKLIKYIDAYYLKEVPESVFIQEAQILKDRMTDAKIEAAFRNWPAPIYALNGDEIIEKIKSRRDRLEKYGPAFYKGVQKHKDTDSPFNIWETEEDKKDKKKGKDKENDND